MKARELIELLQRERPDAELVISGSGGWASLEKADAMTGYQFGANWVLEHANTPERITKRPKHSVVVLS